MRYIGELVNKYPGHMLWWKKKFFWKGYAAVGLMDEWVFQRSGWHIWGGVLFILHLPLYHSTLRLHTHKSYLLSLFKKPLWSIFVLKKNLFCAILFKGLLLYIGELVWIGPPDELISIFIISKYIYNNYW